MNYFADLGTECTRKELLDGFIQSGVEQTHAMWPCCPSSHRPPFTGHGSLHFMTPSIILVILLQPYMQHLRDVQCGQKSSWSYLYDGSKCMTLVGSWHNYIPPPPPTHTQQQDLELPVQYTFPLPITAGQSSHFVPLAQPLHTNGNMTLVLVGPVSRGEGRGNYPKCGNRYSQIVVVAIIYH